MVVRQLRSFPAYAPAPRGAGRRGAFRRARARAAFCAALLATLAAVALGPRAARSAELGDGVFLVASPELKDPNFARSVVLVLRHDDNGTIGVVINRITNLDPAKVFPELAPNLGTYAGKLFRGGPVGPSRLLFLVRGLAAATVQGPEVTDKVFLAGDPDGIPDILRLADGPNEFRMYAGHAEWTAGQLEAEIKRGGWRVVAADADLVFAEAPQKLWNELAVRGPEVIADARR